MNYKIAQTTYDNIFGALGNAENFNEGEIKKGFVTGQTEEDIGDGALYFKPAIFEYSAIVKLRDGKKEWEITSVKLAL